MMNEILQEKLIQKEEYISILKEQIQFLKMSSVSPTVEKSISYIPHEIRSRTPLSSSPQVSATPEAQIIPSSFSEAVDSSLTILRGPFKPVKVPDCRGKLKAKHGLSIVYFLGLRQQKIGEFRKQAKSSGLSLQSVQNISFIGKSIAELLIESDSQQAFVNQAKSLGFNVRVDLSITDKTKDNPVWVEYGHEGSSLSDVIKSNFIRRISFEIKSTMNERIRQYYLDWVEALGWKDSLLVASTLTSSP
jgi:hypothetical protein